MNVAVGRPLNCSACARIGSMSSPSSAPTAQAMLSSTFRFSVRIAPALISAVVAPTTKSATSSTMCSCVMALALSHSTTVESNPREQRRPRPNAYLLVGRTSQRSSTAQRPNDGAGTRRLAECRLRARGRRGEVHSAVDHLDLGARDEGGAGVRLAGAPIGGNRVAVDLKAFDRSTAKGGNRYLDIAE